MLPLNNYIHKNLFLALSAGDMEYTDYNPAEG